MEETFGNTIFHIWGVTVTTVNSWAIFESNDNDSYFTIFSIGGYACFSSFRFSIPLHYVETFRRRLKAYIEAAPGIFTDPDGKPLPPCEDVLRHKGVILHLDWFRDNAIPLVRIVQNPGEYIVTCPQGYHFGVNMGVNCNEAVNFATTRWIKWGKIMGTKCTCG